MMGVRRKYVRQVTVALLRDRGVNAGPVDVERIVRETGAVLVRQDAPDDVSGFLYRSLEGGAPIIGVNNSHHRHRQRFTIAHELGHLLLHETGEVHVDRAEHGFRLRLRDRRSSEGSDDDEKEANYFAAELLMPAAFLERDLAKAGAADALDLLNQYALASLAETYDVSPQALTYRLIDLGYTDG